MSGIDGSAAHLSDALFTTAIFVYAIAMVGYTAEYAFGRVARKKTAVAAPAARELVPAGSPSTTGFAPLGGPNRPENGPEKVQSAVRRTGRPSTRRAGRQVPRRRAD